MTAAQAEKPTVKKVSTDQGILLKPDGLTKQFSRIMVIEKRASIQMVIQIKNFSKV
jgi:hypothetical protein